MSETDATKIQLAADYIFDESGKRGMPVSADVALSIARKLWDYWSRPGGVQRHIPPGEIAQRFRERYAAQGPNVSDLGSLAVDMIELPLVNSNG